MNHHPPHHHHHHHQLQPEFYPPINPSNQTIHPTSSSAPSYQSNLKSSNPSSKTSFRYRTFNTSFGSFSVNDLLRKDWIKYYIITVVIIVLIALVSIYHHQIIIALHPYVKAIRDLKVNGVEIGWIIPILTLFIISFPPLFGHEIVIILCGLVWGLWIGFLIASAGTFLGEVANYWLFKYACSHRAAKLEKKDLNYACMCTVIRQGGFWIAFLARLSAIPGHLVTPVFATTGMGLWVYCTALLLSMPKQLSGVYLGTLFNVEDPGQPKSATSKLVQYSVLGLSFLITVFAALYIYREMAKVRALAVANEQISSPETAINQTDYHQDNLQFYGIQQVPSSNLHPTFGEDEDARQSLIHNQHAPEVQNIFPLQQLKGDRAQETRHDVDPFDDQHMVPLSVRESIGNQWNESHPEIPLERYTLEDYYYKSSSSKPI
ncbi:hypothetical protein O181_055876 [Austropuccinia psidii MF-1]|uniref:Golgi apparatus membrane protein TVP38 n=1 Tax=Austropuccinia psidii MF-1 TaxID=1389203 RepID=A0A9Q3HSG1_9BASI|nr:hypothetical protein [Austropuccinia psidii MF-1]